MSREPLHNEQTEKVLLGCMMTSPDVIDDVTRILPADKLYLGRHATIFRAILAAREAGKPTDPFALALQLAGTGDLSKIGGGPYLHELVAMVPVAAQATHYARELAILALARGMTVISIHADEYAHTIARTNPGAAVDRIQAELDALTITPDADDPVLWADLVQPGFDDIEAAGRGDGARDAVPTGIKDLDRLLGGGLKPGLIIVAARTSMGKSVAARGFLRSAAFRHKLPSILFTQEMDRGEVFKAILSAECSIPLHLVDEGKLSDGEWTKAARFVADTVEAPLFVDDTPMITLAEIRAKCRRMRQRFGGLGLVVVDYLQLLEVDGRESRQLAVASLSRGLKILSSVLHCPVVAVSQLNRGPEMRADKHPQLADLRESGAIENDANVVILIHREDYYDKESPRRGEADLIVAKQRGGPLGTVTVASQLHLSRFVDMAVV